MQTNLNHFFGRSSSSGGMNGNNGSSNNNTASNSNTFSPSSSQSAEISEEQKQRMEFNRYEALAKAASKSLGITQSEILSKGSRVRHIETGVVGTVNMLEKKGTGSIMVDCRDLFGQTISGSPLKGKDFVMISEQDFQQQKQQICNTNNNTNYSNSNNALLSPQQSCTKTTTAASFHQPRTPFSPNPIVRQQQQQPQSMATNNNHSAYNSNNQQPKSQWSEEEGGGSSNYSSRDETPKRNVTSIARNLVSSSSSSPVLGLSDRRSNPAASTGGGGANYQHSSQETGTEHVSSQSDASSFIQSLSYNNKPATKRSKQTNNSFDESGNNSEKKPRTATAASSSSAAKNRRGASSSANDSMYASAALQTNKANNDVFWWLRDNAIRDGQGHRPCETGYDPRTVFIPPDSEKGFTGFNAQYWSIKRDNFDVLLFCKVGKFYELYERDAIIGHKELGLQFAATGGQGNKMMCVGVPEAKFTENASKLVALSYKVGCVEEMQKAAEKEKKDRSVVKRELRRIYTPGTLVEDTMMGDDAARQLLTLIPSADRKSWGLCAVDAAIGKFYIGRLQSDESMSSLHTLLLQVRPSEILIPCSLENNFRRMLREMLPMSVVSSLRSELWAATKARLELKSAHYFQEGKLPAVVDELWEDDLVVEALGGCVGYLKRLKLDADLVGIARFYKWNESPEQMQSRYLVMDATMLSSMEILEPVVSTSLGNASGEGMSLYSYLDRCVTPYGKRRLRWWVTHPLKYKADIEERQTAMQDLVHLSESRRSAEEKLRISGDVERLIARVHSHAKKASFGAVLNDPDELDRRVMKDLVAAVEGIATILGAIDVLYTCSGEMKSKLLRDTVSLNDFGCVGHLVDNDSMPSVLSLPLSLKSDGEGPGHEDEPPKDMKQRAEQCLDAIRRGFIFETITGKMLINDQECEDVQSALAEVSSLRKMLDDYLFDQRQKTAVSMRYVSSGKEPYLIEIPSHCAHEAPAHFVLISATKSGNKYSSPDLSDLLHQLSDAEDALREARRASMQALCVKFDSWYSLWSLCVSCAAQLDVLCSLSKISSGGLNMTWPTIVEDDEVVLSVEAMDHPFMTRTAHTDAFVPISIHIGGSAGAPMAIITGPNMGGKSTALRLSCLAVILAQLGCAIPAAACTITPADRIFARLGARDDIMQGRSTFMIEMQETAAMLKSATRHSLLVLDELGRGTSTFDGYAIAHAVVSHLSDQIQCRTLFATHYHSLATDFCNHPNVAFFHMACMVNDEEQSIVFLYQMAQGSCPKSYGTHCARAAHLPPAVVSRADEISSQFENGTFTKLKKKRPNPFTNSTRRTCPRITNSSNNNSSSNNNLDDEEDGMDLELGAHHLELAKSLMNINTQQPQSIIATYQAILSSWIASNK